MSSEFALQAQMPGVQAGQTFGNRLYSSWQRRIAVALTALAVTGCAAKPDASINTTDTVSASYTLETTATYEPSTESSSSALTTESFESSTSANPTTTLQNPSSEVSTQAQSNIVPEPPDNQSFTVVIKSTQLGVGDITAVVHRAVVPAGEFAELPEPEGHDWMDTSVSPTDTPFPQSPNLTAEEGPVVVMGHRCVNHDCPFTNVTLNSDGSSSVGVGTEVDFVSPTGTVEMEVCGIGLSPKKVPGPNGELIPNPVATIPPCEGQEVPDGVILTCNVEIDPVTGKRSSTDNIVIVTRQVGATAAAA